MQYALRNNERIEAQKGVKDAVCPCCASVVVPKCGLLNVHHWAHKTKEHCDPWYEPETKWHRGWKAIFDESEREVVVKKDGEKHIADVKLTNGTVVEVQHSSITYEEILRRSVFYEKIVWIVDGNDFEERFYIYDRGTYHTFRWKQGRKCWNINLHKVNVVIDFSEKYDKVFIIRKMYTDDGIRGWGYWFPTNDVIQMIKKGQLS